MTLIELLVVIVLVTTLVTTAIPILSPGGDSRKIREASRSLNTLLSGAQMRAIESGRPFGVAFKRLSADTRDPADNGVCVEAFQVEVPPAYSGLDSTSRARMCRRPLQLGLSATLYQIEFVARSAGQVEPLPAGWRYDLVPSRFLQPGDLIEIDGQMVVLLASGRGQGDQSVGYSAGEVELGEDNYFPSPEGSQTRFVVRPATGTELSLAIVYDSRGRRILDPETSTQNVVIDPESGELGASGVTPENWVGWTEPSAYKIFRQPTPATGDPLQMPVGAAIDLQASGFSDGQPLYKPSGVWNSSGPLDEPDLVTDPVMILFSPEGTLSRVYAPDYDATASTAPLTEQIATSSLSLLVGRRELIPPEEGPRPNGRYDTPAQIADEPIVLETTQTITDEEAEQWRESYNWLSLNSRWVVIGAQSGSVTTVPNTFLGWRDLGNLNRDGDQYVTLGEQLRGAREAVALRSTEGGR